MSIHDRHELKAAAEEALTHAPNQKKLVLIWAAVSTALPLLASVLSFILDGWIADTGGLAGIGLRSVLSTAQSILDSGVSLLLPFLTLGYTAAVLRFSRKESADALTLLEGFRRFGPALRLMLLKAFMIVGLCIPIFYGSIMLLSMTPLLDPAYEILEQNQSMLASGTLDEATLAAVSQALTPACIICCCLCLLLVIPYFYRLRLAEFCLLDSDSRSGMLAIRESRRLMRRNRIALFRLDLSFWWYYLAQLLLTALCYGDVILRTLNISLPFNADTAFFVFYIAALAAQFGLFCAVENKVQTTYAMFYNALRTPPEEKTGLII